MDPFPALWRIELFGSLHARRADQTLERFPTQKTGALLARLAFTPGRRQTREELAGLLWPDAPLPAARDRLSQILVWLRPRLEPEGTARGSVLVTDRLTVSLAPAAVITDVAEFEAALARAGRTSHSAERIAALTEANVCYRADLLSGFYDDWVLTERDRLRNACLSALRQLAALHAEQGDDASALEYARRAVTLDPLHEEAHLDLIRLLTAQGQTTAALRHYQEWKRILAQELGVAPSATAQALAQTLTEAPAAPQRVAPSRDAALLPVALPTPLTRFFGREVEQATLLRLVRTEKARLITLTGVGGAGKTRLVLAVAAQLTTDYPDSVLFVPVADIDDAALLPHAIAAALRLPVAEKDSTLPQVIAALSQRPFLLLLDNLEHLQQPGALLVRTLLNQVPTVTILVTSRQRLGLDGEQELSVAPLPLPPAAAPMEEVALSASAQLFVDRARAARADFALTDANADLVARLCARLDGIPLALELCAAWAQTLTLSQMLENLDQRFDLLISRRADITPRHRTLRAALEYSYLLLPPELRRLFVRLSIFRGGWNLEAAAGCAENGAVAPLSLLADLTELRERSLIVADEVRVSGTETQMRYRMLETLREFGGNQLTFAERATLRRSHALYFRALAEQAEVGITGAEQERWLTALDQEQENLRAALHASLEAEQWETGLRLAAALCRYWLNRGYLKEGYDWLRQLLDASRTQSTIPDTVRSKAWTALGYLAWSQGEYATARTAHEQALVLRRTSGQPLTVAESLYHLGITTYRLDDYAAAKRFTEESLRIAQAHEDVTGVARALLNLGNIAYEQDDYDAARELFERSLVLERQRGDRQRIADCLNNLGLVYLAEKNYAEADRLFTDALAIRRSLNEKFGTSTVLVNSASTARLRGNRERSRRLLEEGLTLAHEIGNKHILSHFFVHLGILESLDGRHEKALFLIGAGQRLFEILGGSSTITHIEGYQEALDASHNVLGEAAFQSAWQRGLSLTSEQTVSLAALASWPDLALPQKTGG